VGQIKYEASVEEIFDVRILPNMRRPGIVNHYKNDKSMLITMPQGNYWANIPSEEADANTYGSETSN
jgi:hypothetical protein